MKEMSRKELQEIEKNAQDMAERDVMNAPWKRAYLRLADAATTLDAFMARREKEKS